MTLWGQLWLMLLFSDLLSRFTDFDDINQQLDMITVFMASIVLTMSSEVDMIVGKHPYEMAWANGKSIRVAYTWYRESKGALY